MLCTLNSCLVHRNVCAAFVPRAFCCMEGVQCCILSVYLPYMMGTEEEKHPEEPISENP